MTQMGRRGVGNRAAKSVRPDQDPQRQKQQPHVVEWVVGAVSAALVLAMVGFLTYEALGEAATGPQLSVVVQRIESSSERFRVAFIGVNRGDSTAAGVKIRGELKSDDLTVETSDATIDYLPAHSEKEGGLLFSRDPRQFRLEIRAAGYTDP